MDQGQQLRRPQAEDFGAQTPSVHGHIVVEVRGEIDAVTGDRFFQAVQAAADPHRRLIIDLTHVTFMDSSGLATLVRVYRSLGQVRESITIRGANRATRKLLKITGVDRLVSVDDRVPPPAPLTRVEQAAS